MANLILWTTFHFQLAPTRTVGAYQLASWLRYHGYTVKVIDFCHTMTTAELVEITKKHISKETLAIGVSSTFWKSAKDNIERINFNGYLEPEWVLAAREQIESTHKIKWLLGGDKAELSGAKFNWVTFLGNSENALLKWMDENSSRYLIRKPFDVQHINNIFEPGDFIQPQETLPIELGRGCMFKCKFCSYPLMGKRPGTYVRNMSLIKEEFIRNYNEYGTKNYFFLDDTVNENHEKIQNLADIAQSLPFELSWTGYNRLDMIASKPETINWLKDSGLASSYFGIESFHPDASSLIGKGWNGKHGKDFLLKLKNEWGDDINWTLSMIVGLNGESKEHLEEVTQWCIDNDMYHWMYFALHIDSSTNKVWKSEFDKNCHEYGYRFENPNKPYNWTSDNWNLSTAYNTANELNAMSKPYQKVASWMLLGLSTLGYSAKQIKHTLISDLPMDDIKLKSNQFIKNYINHQLYSV